MDNTEVIKITDTTKIKRVVFKEPELMAPDAEEQIKKEFYYLKDLESRLHKLRNKVIELEDEYKNKKDSYNRKSALFTIEFETKEVEKTIGETSTIMYKNLGNDILGTFNS